MRVAPEGIYIVHVDDCTGTNAETLVVAINHDRSQVVLQVAEAAGLMTPERHSQHRVADPVRREKWARTAARGR
jgi:hypothetical protein